MSINPIAFSVDTVQLLWHYMPVLLSVAVIYMAGAIRKIRIERKHRS